MRAAWLLVIVVCALGCGELGGPSGDDQCAIGIDFDPAMPIAGPTTEVRANSVVDGAAGVLTYDWRVRFNGALIPHTDAQVDGRDITFPAHDPGVYEVSLQVSGGAFCPAATQQLTVAAEDPHVLHVRLHITPPITTTAPPYDRRLTINGGGDVSLGPVVLDPGVRAIGTVTTSSGGAGVIAYLKFLPLGRPDAAVEAYSTAAGAFDAHVVDQAHDVLVIPSAPGLAPRRFASWMPGQSFSLDAGSPITGSVLDPSGLGLGNTKVQLTIDGVPSSLGTTAANGSFALRGVPAPGKLVKIEVTPPAASGLPRLEAIDTFDLAQPFFVTYDSDVSTRDLAGTHVRRGGIAQANAKVTIVGSLAAIGSVSNGLVSASATGIVRVAVSADGTGALPPTRVPALPMTAVVNIASSDLAVAALDLTSGVPADIIALPMQGISTEGRDPSSVAIPGIVLDLVPIGVLAQAGAPIVHLVGDDAGQITGLVANGGHYDARWYDASGSGGPLVVTDVTTQTLAVSYTLPPALVISGEVSITGNPNAISGAAVQILCGSCDGIERTRPIAEVASDRLGRFDVAVPDPGTM